METEIDKVVKEIADSKLSTSHEIKIMKNTMLQRLMFDKDEMKHYNKLLTNYRYIDEIDELKYGSYIRWFNINKNKTLKLLNGGFIIDITTKNDDIIILCKNGLNRLFSLKMNETIIFQKNTKQEEVLIKILDHVTAVE
jgi:hypothetical protein